MPENAIVCSHLRQVSVKDLFHQIHRVEMKHWWLFVYRRNVNLDRIQPDQQFVGAEGKYCIAKCKVVAFEHFVAVQWYGNL
jgi:rubrerythrin